MSDLRTHELAGGGTPQVSSLRGVRAAAGALAVLAVCLQSPAQAFSYDAGHYWGGASALVNGGSVFESGLLSVRGVLTSFLYLPAAAASRLLGEGAAGAAVLLENALLIAVVGVVLLPALVGLWRPVTTVAIWFCATAAVLLLRGFAPFPLTDLWAATLLLTAVVALDGRGTVRLLLAGLAAGLAFHVRPAALIPVVALVVAVLIARRVGGLWFVGGALLALVPQFALNRWKGTSWLPWPEATAALTHVQARYASFVVRYDTDMSGRASDPRLFFCSPRMAHALGDTAPDSSGGLAVAFLSHPLEAVVLSAQKVGAALHWPLSTPYFVPSRGSDGLFAVLVTVVAVIGGAAILRATFRHGWRALTLPHAAALLALGGSVLTLTTSATETRFALPLLLVGIAGCALVTAEGLRRPSTRAGRIWVAATSLAVVVLFGSGVWGLQHPVVGDVTVTRCATS